MTIIEMQTLIDLLLDKAGAPWQTAIEKDRVLNMAQIEFAQSRGDKFEFTERRRSDLMPITRKYTVLTQNFIDTGLVTDFMRVAALIGTFSDLTCAGAKITRPIPPIPFDDFESANSDPFKTPTNDYPGYIQYNDGTINKLEVKSTTTADNLILYYIKIPRSVNSQSLPIVNSELPVSTHDEIVNIAVRKFMMIIQDQNYQVQLNEINSQEPMKS